MTNLEKYNSIFVEVFGVEVSALDNNFSKETVDQWDSVHQLNIVTLVEDSFDIMLDPEDIMGFISYGAGKGILRRQGFDI